nr:hypothetical protein FFPRI1PSEUD_27320 [Pseudomonas sp. FFPRI_1]
MGGQGDFTGLGQRWQGQGSGEATGDDKLVHEVVLFDECGCSLDRLADSNLKGVEKTSRPGAAP